MIPLSFFTNTYPFIFKPVSPVHPAISNLPFYQFLTFHFRYSQYLRFLKNTFLYFTPMFFTYLPLSIFILFPYTPHLYLLHTRYSTTFIEATQTILHRQYRLQTTPPHKALRTPLTKTYKIYLIYIFTPVTFEPTTRPLTTDKRHSLTPKGLPTKPPQFPSNVCNLCVYMNL